MKSIKRFLGKQYTSRPSQGNEDTNDPPRPSTSRWRSTQPQTEREIPTSSGQYQKSHDNKLHISYGTYGPNPDGSWFGIRSIWHTANLIYQKISTNAEVKRIIDNIGWCGIFGYEMPNSDRSVVETCIFRWWNTTHTFQLPKYEIGITPLDFTMLTSTLFFKKRFYLSVLYIYLYTL